MKDQSSEFVVQGATFELTLIPPYQTFSAGAEAEFTFKVKNIGNQEGTADLSFKAYDMIDSTRTEWLMPGEEKEIAFSFILPDDLEEKDYYANYSLSGKESVVNSQNGQVKYHVAGINIGVTASLDKQYYNNGETATLALHITDNRTQRTDINLFAGVNYNGHEEQKSFTLNGSRTLTFDVPLTEITGEKLFYGIYHEAGRSIHLNTIYVYKAGETITITTDKQVYDPGETVSVVVSSEASGVSGTMTLTGPGEYSETFEFTGISSKSLSLPTTMKAGTYPINAELRTLNSELRTASHPIDVNGIQVKIIEAKLDKAKYASTDTITANFTITSNTNLSAMLKTWVVDPSGKYTVAGEGAIALSTSAPLLTTQNAQLTTAVSGIHRLVYGIYFGDLLLSSGSEAFDVGDAVLLGIATDKSDYPANNEPVTAKVSMYGTVDAGLELQIDGTQVRTEAVTLNGFTTMNFELGTINPGSHTLKAILTTGGLNSAKETSFTYGSSLPDLTAGVGSQGSGIGKNGAIDITATIMNQGKDPSSATTVAIYDGESFIETKSVKALNSGEYENITISWSVFGKAGDHVIKAIVDPDNTVIEYNENNNKGITYIQIPDMTLITETDKDTYKIRQKVYVTTTMTNLTSDKTYNSLVLSTTAKDPSGTTAYSNSASIGSLGPSSSTSISEIWSTAGLPVDGVYTITQEVSSGAQLVTHNSKLVSLQAAPDFTLATDITSQKIKQGEEATYIASINPFNGWNMDVSMSIEGLPAGTTVTFNPDRLIPPGQSQTLVITTGTTNVGIHTLYLTAQGTDEGEIVVHTVPITLDVSGYGLETTASEQTIKQIETATFPISLTSLNGYEGNVSLNISGMPYGTKATLDNAQLTVPGTAALTVVTSKYAKPGTYTLTIAGDDGLATHNLNLNLVLQPNPDIAAGIIATQGPGPQNEAVVKVYDSDLNQIKEFTAFTTKYGVSAITADINGDGYDEIIVAQGPDPKNPATFRVLRRDGTPFIEHTAFDTKYSLTLAGVDIDGDWVDEIIVGMGPDPKNPGTIKILKYTSAGFTEVMNKTIYPDTGYGINIATGDVDGDGTPEIITSPGPGPNNPAAVTIWQYSDTGLTEMKTFPAFEGTYGANITTGDIDNDGKHEIITGTGPDPKNTALVRIYDQNGNMLKEITAYDEKHTYGVNVTSADLDNDGIAEVITGPGPGPQNEAQVKIFSLSGKETESFNAYPDNVKYGVKVSGGRTGR